MAISLYTLFYLGLVSLGGGFLLGGFYDLLRVLRFFAICSYSGEQRICLRHYAPSFPRYDRMQVCPRARAGRGAGLKIFLEDLLFFFVVGIFLVILLYHGNEGEFRLLSPLSAVAGFGLYFFTVGRLTSRLAPPIVKALKWGGRSAFLLLTWPLFWTLGLVCLGYDKVCAAIGRNRDRRAMRIYTAREMRRVKEELSKKMNV